MDGTLGIVGGGRMGEALLAGMLEAGTVTPGQVTVSDAVQARVDELARALGITGTTANREALGADVVILAVKPQVLPAVLETDGDAVRDEALVVSIAAGTSTATIDHLLPGAPAIVRVMPNTPALVGQGASGVAPGPRATSDHLDVVEELLAPTGIVRRVGEASLDAVTGVSGSGPAYVFLLAEALAEAGVLQGLSRADAVALANQTIAGAGALLTADRGSATELREAVTSPGGTTAAALQVLERSGLRGAVDRRCHGVEDRARELG